jgi:hypothetical protein
MSASSEVGYGRPPTTTRFKKGQSGNPRGRPRNRRKGLPYDSVLGQMVTVREDGREKRVTAAEAFLLQLTKKGLEGDSASVRSSLSAIEAARSKRHDLSEAGPTGICIVCVEPGSVTNAVKILGMGVTVEKASETCRLLLSSWIIEAALARLGRRLSPDDQRLVWASTRTPGKVRWPEWWEIFG